MTAAGLSEAKVQQARNEKTRWQSRWFIKVGQGNYASPLRQGTPVVGSGVTQRDFAYLRSTCTITRVAATVDRGKVRDMAYAILELELYPRGQL